MIGLRRDTDAWSDCRFLTCSVLPVRQACDLECHFCFSKSSVSALASDRADWRKLDIDAYYAWARARGASRLVVTGGGEPLLRAEDVLYLIAAGRRYFDEIACFTNGSFLTRPLAHALVDAGLSYLCYSRHHWDDARCRALMGPRTRSLEDFFRDAGPLTVRATCVMSRGFVETPDEVRRYMDALARFGVRQFTFKHTYVAFERSLFAGSEENQWARQHQVERDPFAGQGQIAATLPWGPEIRDLGDCRVCYYYEPSPSWEQENGLCRSSNLLSDGRVFASLEDTQSLLFQLPRS